MFFSEYKNNKSFNKKYADGIEKDKEKDYFAPDEPDKEELKDRVFMIKESLDNIKEVKEKVKEEILNENVEADPFFDEKLFDHLDNLHEYISNYIPNYPKYYTKDKKINPKAFLDARDILKNELPLNTEEIVNTPTSLSGATNDSKMNFENGYQVDFSGNIYNPENKIIFNPRNPHEKIRYIDFLNQKVVTEHGIRVDIPQEIFDPFVEYTIYSNEHIDQDFKDRLKELKKTISDKKVKIESEESNKFSASETPSIDDIYATVYGTPITYKDRLFVQFDIKDTYIGDLFGDKQNSIDIVEQLNKYNRYSPSLGICNFKDIPYAELNSKLFWGGGARGKRPLASNSISDKDIRFAPNGTVYYTGANSTITTHRPGCRSKTYKTGHVCMWSSSNRTGIKTSIIQYIYKFCNTFGLFNANIPPLVGYKSIKIFPGLCIGGLLEMALCAWQERISKRINEMFRCDPSKLPSDDSNGLFENQTYPYGSTVSNLEELDTVKSCKFGDRYVVELVPKEITGLSEVACGVFVFDPNNKLENAYKWKYKNWNGRPFNARSTNNITDREDNMYNNPIIQDTLMNTNSLGEDSITRKLMSLQYAYMRKETLLSVNDINLSFEAIVQSAIYEIMDKLTFRIANYISLLDFLEQMKKSDLDRKYSIIPENGTPIPFAHRFLDMYSSLIEMGLLKEIPLEKCLRKKHITKGNGDGGTQQIEVQYYDFSGYDPNVYLVPTSYNVSEADAMAFSALYVPTKEIKETFNNNINMLKKIDGRYKDLRKVKTIREFINISDERQSLEKDIEDNLRYTKQKLKYDGYDKRAVAQIEKRCEIAINKKKIF